MKNRKECTGKYAVFGVLLLPMLLFLLFHWRLREADTSGWVKELDIAVRTEQGIEWLKPWMDEEGMVYGFLPACAEEQNIGLRGAGIMLGDIPLDELQWISLELGEPVPLVKGGESLWITFLKAEQLPSAHIQTISGNLNRVYRDKTKTEQIELAIYSADGTAVYANPGYHDRIRGHGNTTWELEKKSFNLKLAQDTSLLGLSSGQNWVLLADSVDASKVRNRFAQQLAREMMDCWTVHGEPVDLYINGEYQGVYLLTEKVEVGVNRIRLGQDGVLFQMDLSSRMTGQAVEELYPGLGAEVRSPASIPETRMREIDAELRKIVEAAASGSMSEAELQTRLDLDSWVQKYLLEEIVMNFDAGACSQYFSLEQHRLISQAPWDYDNSLGASIHANPDTFIARRIWKDETTAAPLYYDLWQYPSFREAVQREYSQTVLPLLNRALETDLDALYERIRASMVMEELRWPGTYSETSSEEAFRDVKNFLRERMAFLNSAWVDGKEYHIICLHLGDFDFPYFAVEDGQPLNSVMAEYADAGLLNQENGEPVDFVLPVVKDLVLLEAEGEPEETHHVSLLSQWQVLLAYFSITMLVLVGIILACLDRKNRKRTAASRELQKSV